MHHASMAVILLLGLSLASSARAEDNLLSAPRQDMAIEHGLGMSYGEDLPTLDMELAYFWRLRPLLVGGSFRAGASGGGNLVGGGLHAGYGFRSARWRLSLLGTLGLRHYGAVDPDRSILSSD